MNMRQTEAGQVLLDKRRHREPLEYMLFLGTQSLYLFPLSYGDKELFLAGFALAGAAADYCLVRQTLGLAWGPHNDTLAEMDAPWPRENRGLVHFSPVDSRPLFLHRFIDNGTKYRLEVPEGRPVDVISGPLAPLVSAKPFSTGRRYRVVDPKACAYSLDDGFDAVEAQCGGVDEGKEAREVVVYPVAGSGVAAAHAAQEAGWKRLLEARRQNPKLFPTTSGH